MQHSPSSPHEGQVAILDDHVLFAQTLELALGSRDLSATRVPFPARNGTSLPLMAAILRARPTVLLLDLDLGPHGDGLPLIEPATKAGISVVVVTGAEEQGAWARAVLAGARTVLSKTQPLADVLTTVQRVFNGLPVMTRDEREHLLDVWAKQRADNAEVWTHFDLLTMRECEVLGQLMQGHSVRGIAQHGYVSEATVRSQVKSILAKLELSSQLAAVGLAYQIGWRAPFQRPLMS